MSLFITAFAVLIVLVDAQDYLQYVNNFIGTQGSVPGTSYNGGNVFPGALLPFGAVKVGIDTTESVIDFLMSTLLTISGSTRPQMLMLATHLMATSLPSRCCTSLALAEHPSMASYLRCL